MYFEIVNQEIGKTNNSKVLGASKLKAYTTY
jgi:hypothetical protein